MINKRKQNIHSITKTLNILFDIYSMNKYVMMDAENDKTPVGMPRKEMVKQEQRKPNTLSTASSVTSEHVHRSTNAMAAPFVMAGVGRGQTGTVVILSVRFSREEENV